MLICYLFHTPIEAYVAQHSTALAMWSGTCCYWEGLRSPEFPLHAGYSDASDASRLTLRHNFEEDSAFMKSSAFIVNQKLKALKIPPFLTKWRNVSLKMNDKPRYVCVCNLFVHLEYTVRI
jgi:hypothetical protein